MRKKSYNPFKMWGSWIGGSVIVCWKILGNYFSWKVNTLWEVIQANFRLQGAEFGIGEFWITLVYFIIGFLLGWLINSLWRKYK